MESFDEVALMRYRIIAPLLEPDLRRGEKGCILKRISEKVYTHPNTQADIRFQPETLRQWVRRYKKRGFEGLVSKKRSDTNSIKGMPESIAQEAIDLKLENPRRTIDGIIQILEKAGKVEIGHIKRSTLHRLFQKRGINVSKTKVSAVFGRFEAQYPNDLWQSDLLFGPKLPDPRRPGQFFTAQLIAFIDDHSRLIPHAQFYYHGRNSNLEHCFRKSLQKRGIPKVVYVDNGAIYHSKHLQFICAHLGIQLKFTKPYHPEGKGKIEKFFSYVRSSFLVEVQTNPFLELDQLNQAFHSWLEMHYHRKIHGGTKEAPLQRFMTHSGKIKYAEEQDLNQAFMIRETKKVQKDCTFQHKNRVYEVLPALVQQEITVLYDPDDLEEVRVLLAGEFFQVAKPIRIRTKVAPKTQLPLALKVKTNHQPLKKLMKEHAKLKNDTLFGPEVIPVPSDGRFTKREFLEMLNRNHFHLDLMEEKEITRFFDQFGPFNSRFAAKCLQLAIDGVGNQKHISFYLDILKGEKNHD